MARVYTVVAVATPGHPLGAPLYKDRISEHKNAIRKANLDYPMAKHFQNVHHSNPEGLMVEGLETIKKNIRGGDRLKSLLQRETFYIYELQATVYPGLNEEIDFSPFL